MRHVTATIFLVFTALAAWAQPVNTDCATAALLCAEQPLTGNNTGAAGVLPGFCGTSNLLWYTFNTNTVGGEVTVELLDIDCPVIVGMDNELSLVVLSNINGCTPASFVVLSGDPCLSQDSTPFGVVIPNLLPSTQYWVIVAGVAATGWDALSFGEPGQWRGHLLFLGAAACNATMEHIHGIRSRWIISRKSVDSGN